MMTLNRDSTPSNRTSLRSSHESLHWKLEIMMGGYEEYTIEMDNKSRITGMRRYCPAEEMQKVVKFTLKGRIYFYFLVL